MTTPKLYSKIPVTVQAILYTNAEDTDTVTNIIEFTNDKFRVITGKAGSVITAEVYDELHETWVGVKDGDYIIRGLKGEFYPHDGDLFPQAYIESWQQEAKDILNEIPPKR